MFTGIVADRGKVVGLRRSADSVTLTIRTKLTRRLKRAASVSVQGACLTVTSVRGSVVQFDVVQETLQRTTLATLHAGDQVNLELPLRLGDRFDGHIVQGHVDGIGRVVAVRRSKTSGWMLTIEVPTSLRRYLLPKGSIAVDGVSLTIASSDGRRCMITLIPETIKRTGLGNLRTGSRVNLETDLALKYLDRVLKRHS